MMRKYLLILCLTLGMASFNISCSSGDKEDEPVGEEMADIGDDEISEDDPFADDEGGDDDIGREGKF